MTHIGTPRKLGEDPVIMPLNIDRWLFCFPLSTDRFFVHLQKNAIRGTDSGIAVDLIIVMSTKKMVRRSFRV